MTYRVGDEYVWLGETGIFYTAGKRYAIEAVFYNELRMNDDRGGNHQWGIDAFKKHFRAASDVSGFSADETVAEDMRSEEQREADHYDPVRVLKDWLSAAGWDRGRGWKDGDPPIIRRVKEAVRRAEQTREPQPVTKKSVLEAAIQTVADRGVPYGGVEDNFNRIASLWQAHLENRYASPDFAAFPVIDAADVAMMMALMKIARLEANPSHADSWIDVAGYAACGGEIGAKLTLDKSE